MLTFTAVQVHADHIRTLLSGRLKPLEEEEQLQAIAAAYPWYPIPHWIKAVNEPGESHLLQKAALYAPDLWQLHFFLHPPENTPQSAVAVVESIPAADFNPLAAEIAPTEEIHALPEETPVDSAAEAPAEPTAPTDPVEDTFLIPPAEEIAPIKELPAIPEDAPADSHANEPTEQTEPTDPAEDTFFIPPAEETPAKGADEAPDAIEAPEAPAETIVPEAEVATPAAIPVQPHTEEPAPALPGTAVPATEGKEATNLPWLEPYHTVDYFASQGIRTDKMDSALLPPSPIDKQVKSFTEWLKTMKKLNNSPKSTFSDPLVEKKASQSIHSAAVETEAMAEVWIKQNNIQEAIKVFGKLILLHPEKSSYFAARIKALNEQI